MSVWKWVWHMLIALLSPRQAACLLDLAVRCLATWTAAGQATAAAAWLQTLTKEAASLPSQPPGRAAAAGDGADSCNTSLCCKLLQGHWCIIWEQKAEPSGCCKS